MTGKFFTETELTYSYAGWLHKCTNPNIFNDMKLLLITIIFTVLPFSLFERHDLNKKEATVWAAVETRNATWATNDQDGHMAIYHPNFLHWAVIATVWHCHSQGVAESNFMFRQQLIKHSRIRIRPPLSRKY